MHVRTFAQCRADALRRLNRIAFVGVGQQHNKFLAAKARHVIAFA